MSEKSEKDKQMFQAYLDNIKAKTGKTPDDFRALAAEKGLTKNSEIVSWLKTDYGLGHGHANAIAHLIVNADAIKSSPDDKIAAHFGGKKAVWREALRRAGGPDHGIRRRCGDCTREVVYQPGARCEKIRHRPDLHRADGHRHQAQGRSTCGTV